MFGSSVRSAPSRRRGSAALPPAPTRPQLGLPSTAGSAAGPRRQRPAAQAHTAAHVRSPPAGRAHQGGWRHSVERHATKPTACRQLPVVCVHQQRQQACVMARLLGPDEAGGGSIPAKIPAKIPICLSMEAGISTRVWLWRASSGVQLQARGLDAAHACMQDGAAQRVGRRRQRSRREAFVGGPWRRSLLHCTQLTHKSP